MRGFTRRSTLFAAAAAAACGGTLAGGVAAAADVTSNGGRIHWAESGRGSQTLIFVHGWTCDATSWAGQVPFFSKRWRVITLDLPGHGLSQPPANGDYSIAGFAKAIEAVRSAAGVQKVTLIGHSMGAAVVREYALMYPQHVDALVLADGLVLDPNFPRPRPSGSMIGAGGLENRTALVQSMIAPGTPAAIRQKIMHMMLSASPETAERAFAETWDVSKWRSEPVTVPVLGVYADHSRLSDPRARKEVFPTMEYHEIQGTDHFLMMEKPREFNEIVADFLVRTGKSHGRERMRG